MSEEEILKKQWKERENLKPTKFYSEDYVDDLQKEIERLNNIINEFETLIKHEITESIFEDNYGRVDAMEYCLATLRELKGDDKE